MSLTDPLSLVISGVTTPLPRTSSEEDRSEYTSADGLMQFVVSHDYKSKDRVRRLLRLDVSKITADVFKTTENRKVGMSVYTVVDFAAGAFTNAELLADWVGFNTLLTASSNAVVSNALGGES